MTMRETGNLVGIFDAMGIKANVDDFILGTKGTITPQEAAERILAALREKEEGTNKS